MAITVDNLYRHSDGGLYCLVSDDTPMKCPVTGDWLDGVTYAADDGRMRSTTKARFDERFVQVPSIPAADLTDNELAMIRRCNPGEQEFDFVRVFEAWHESEMGITGHMLELAVGACVEKFSWLNDPPKLLEWDGENLSGVTLTIGTEDIQRVAQSFAIERVPEPHGFTFIVRKNG